MGNALRDQLLKAGLVDEKQVKKAQKDKRKESRQSAAQKNAASADRQGRQQQTAEKAARDRELNRARQEAIEQKAVAAQIKQLVEAHKVGVREGDLPYRFVDDGKVKTLYVTEAVRSQIARGSLAIVKTDGRYELVPADTAAKIRSRAQSQVVLWNQPGSSPADSATDEYAGYSVPDDLIW